MDQPTFGFTYPVAKRLRRMASFKELPKPVPLSVRAPRTKTYIAITQEVIPGFVDPVVGSGIAYMYYIDDNDELTMQTDFGSAPVEIIVYNLSESSVGAFKRIIVTEESLQGKALVMWEDCG